MGREKFNTTQDEAKSQSRDGNLRFSKLYISHITVPPRPVLRTLREVFTVPVDLVTYVRRTTLHARHRAIVCIIGKYRLIRSTSTRD